MRVPRHDHDDGVPVVLHQLHQRVDGLPPEVPAGVLGRQRVRLIDEQDSATGPFERLLRADRGRTDVLADQVDPGHLHEVAVLQHTEGGQDLAVQPRHRRLARTGGAGEHEVPAHRRRLEAREPAAPADLDHVGQRPHLALDAVQTHQRVQLPEDGARIAHRLRRDGRDGGLGGALTRHRTEQSGRRLGRRQDRRGRGVAPRSPLSSLVQSFTTGPPLSPSPGKPDPSANSYPPRAHRSVRQRVSVERQPSMTWKP